MNVFCDVDGVLLIWPKHPGRSGDGKNPKTQEMMANELKRRHSNGDKIYLWSKGGPDHCRRAAKLNNIEEIISGYLPKPDVIYDDATPELWLKKCKWNKVPYPDGRA